MTAKINGLSALLERRGILSVAAEFGWQEHVRLDAPGWKYPVFDSRANIIGHRWKSANGKGPKYTWEPKRPERARYYMLPGAARAIRDSGLVFLAAGEPDVLAYRAAGVVNALCWFDGESAIPDTFVEDMHSLHTDTIVYCPDRDDAGLKAAVKLHRLLEPTDISLVLNKLPGDLGSKNDINALWGMAGHDAAQFTELFALLKPLDLSDIYQPGTESRPVWESAGDDQDDIRRWRNEWIQVVIEAVGGISKKKQRCRLPGHDDHDPSFRISADQCPDFPWPVCSCGIQDAEDAWEQVAEAWGAISWEDFKAQKRVMAQIVDRPAPPEAESEQEPNTHPAVDPAALFVSSPDIYDYIEKELGEETLVPDIEPLDMPYAWLREFEGFAEVIMPGSLAYVLGAPGTGKTTFLECMAEEWMRQGYDVIWWGPEWSPVEMGYRTLQRMNGATIRQMVKQQRWRIEDAAGVAPEKRTGMRLGMEVTRRAGDKVFQMQQWPGRAHYIQKMGMPLSQLLASIKAMTAALRADGRKVAVLMIDYFQLLKAQAKNRRDSATILEDIATDIKTLCVDSRLVGFAASQPRKGDSAQTRDGKKLGSSGGQGLSDQQCKLYLTISAEFDEDTEDKTGRYFVRVVKNNLGRTGEKELYPDLPNLRWPLQLTGIDLRKL